MGEFRVEIDFGPVVEFFRVIGVSGSVAFLVFACFLWGLGGRLGEKTAEWLLGKVD